MGFVKVGKMLGTMLAQMFGHNGGTNVERHFCDTLPSHRDCVADDLEQPGRKKRMNDKKSEGVFYVLVFPLPMS